MSIEILVSILIILSMLLILLILKNQRKQVHSVAHIRSYLDAQLKDFMSKIENKKNELEHTSSQADTSINKAHIMNNLLEENFNKIKGQIKDLNEYQDNFSILQNKTDHLGTMFKDLSEKIETLKQQEDFILKMNDDLHKVKEESEKLNSHLHNNASFITEALEEKKEELQKKLKDSLHSFNKQIGEGLSYIQDESQLAIQNSLQSYDTVLSEWIQNSTAKLEVFQNKIAEDSYYIEDFKNNKLNDFEKLMENKATYIDHFVKDYQIRLEDKEIEIDSMVEQQKKVFDDNFTNASNMFQKHYKELRNELSTLINNAYAQMEDAKEYGNSLKQDFDQSFHIQTQSIEKKIHSFQSAIQKIDEITEQQELKITRGLEVRISELNERVDEQLSKLNTQINNNENIFHTMITQFSSEIEKNMQNSLDKSEYQKNTIHKMLQDIEQKTEESLSDFSHRVQNTLNTTLADINQEKKQIQSHISELSSESKAVRERLENIINEEILNLKSSIQHQKNEIMSEKQQYILDLRQEVYEHIDNSKDKTQEFIKSYEQLTKIREQEEQKIREFAERQAKETESLFLSKQEFLLEKLKSIEDKQYFTQNRLEEMIENCKGDLETFKYNHRLAIDESIKNVEFSYDNTISTIQEKRNSLLIKIETDLKNQEIEIKKKVESATGISSQQVLDLQKHVEGKVLEIESFVEKHKYSLQEEIHHIKNTNQIFLQEIREQTNKTIISAKDNLEKQREFFKEEITKNLDDVKNSKYLFDKEIKENMLPNQIKMFTEEIDMIKEKATYHIQNAQDRVMDQTQDLKSNMNKIFEHYDDKIKQMQEMHSSILEQNKNLHSEKIEIFIKEEKTKLQELSQALITERHLFDEEIQRQKIYINAFLEDNQKKLKQHQNDIETTVREKEAQLYDQLFSRSENALRTVNNIESKIQNMDSLITQAVGKSAKEIQEQLQNLEQTIDSTIHKNLSYFNEEINVMKDIIEKTKAKSYDIQKDTQKEIQEKIRSMEQSFQSHIMSFEQELSIRKSTLESMIAEKTKEISSISHYLRDDFNKLNSQFVEYKNDKKLNLVLQEIQDIDSSIRRIEKANESLVDNERLYQKMKKDIDSMLNEIGKFEAKKEEIETLNQRITQNIIKARETDERIELLYKKSGDLLQIEHKIKAMNEIYNEIQDKADIVASKEQRLTSMIQKIELNNASLDEIKQEMALLEKEAEKGLRKTEIVQEKLTHMTLSLEEVKLGEDKIDNILDKFQEIEGLSLDLQSRLKQLAGATDRLDLAEARVKNLLGILDSPETLEKTLKKGFTEKSKLSSVSAADLPQTKIDAIRRYKQNGFSEDVIANIFEIHPNQVEQILKKEQ